MAKARPSLSAPAASWSLALNSMRLGRGDKALQIVVVAADRRQRQTFDHPVGSFDGDIRLQAFRVARQAQTHASPCGVSTISSSPLASLPDTRNGSGV